jgi:hypothetical protein
VKRIIAIIMSGASISVVVQSSATSFTELEQTSAPKVVFWTYATVWR